MAERHIVDAVEDSRGHGGDPADRDVPLAVAGLPARHEGVGEDDGAGASHARGEIRPDALHGRGQHLLVSGLGGLELVADQGRFEVGQPVEGHFTVGVGQQHRGAAPGRVGAQMDARPLDEARADAESPGRVVVPGDHDRRHALLGEPVDGAVEELHGRERRHGPVVDIPCHEDRVHVVLAHRRHQVVEERCLGVEQGDPVERPSQVPVRRVQESHDPRG